MGEGIGGVWGTVCFDGGGGGALGVACVGIVGGGARLIDRRNSGKRIGKGGIGGNV